MEREKVTEVMSMRLYDIMNLLGALMKDNNTKKEFIQLRGINQHTKQWNTITVTLEETWTGGYTPQGGTGMGGGMIGFEVIKSIGRLEQRIDELENRITKLGG